MNNKKFFMHNMSKEQQVRKVLEFIIDNVSFDEMKQLYQERGRLDV